MANFFDQFDAPKGSNFFDQFDEAPQGKEPGLLDRVKQGLSSTVAAGKIAATDDPARIAEIIAENQRGQLPQSPTQQKMAAEIKPYQEAYQKSEGVDAIGAFASLAAKRLAQFVSNPSELAGAVAENLPNSAPGLAGGAAGAYAGSAAGPVGTGVGAVAGGTAGGYLIEQGSAMRDQVLKAAQEMGIDPRDSKALEPLIREQYDSFLEKSRLKGIGTAGTDAVLNALTFGVAGAGERVLAKEARALTEGVKTGTLGTAEAATQLASIEARQAARMTMPARAVRGTGIIGAEMAGEGLSEAAGQKLAYGTVDPLDVVDESLLGLGQGAGMAAGRGTFNKLTGQETADTVEQSMQRARVALEAAGNAGQAVGAANEMAGSLDNILRATGAAELSAAVDAYLTPGIPAPAAPVDTSIPALQARADRESELLAQANAANTNFDRRMALEQLEASRPAVEPGAAAGYADLTPMDERQAQQRLTVMRDEAAQGFTLNKPLELAVVPHPAQPGAFAIAKQQLPSLDLSTPASTITAGQAQNRIESAALTGKLATAKAEDQSSRQVVIDRAIRNVQERGGVASPAEAQIFQEAGVGKPYDRIDTSLAPALSMDQQLTQATGIALDQAPRSESTQQTGPTTQQLQQQENNARSDSRLEQLANDRAAAQQQAPATTATAPDGGAVIDALKTPGAQRTAEQQLTIRQARDRYSASDFSVLERAAKGTFQLNPMERMRLVTLTNSSAAPAVASSQQTTSEPVANATTGLMGERVARALGLPTNGTIVQGDVQMSPVRGAPGETITVNDGDGQHTLTTTDTLTKLPGMTSLVRELARLFGKRVVIFNSDTLKADGFVRKGNNRDIFINANSTMSPLAVFGHELMHLLKRDNPIAYRAVAAVVARRMDSETRAQFRADYGSGASLEELSSDLMGNAFQDEQFLTDVFTEIGKLAPEGQARSVIMRLAAAINKAVKQALAIVRAMPADAQAFKADELVKNLEEIRTALKGALVTYAKEQRIEAIRMEGERGRAEASVDLKAGSQDEPASEITTSAEAEQPEAPAPTPIQAEGNRLREAARAARQDMGETITASPARGKFRDIADSLGLTDEQYNATALALMTGLTKDKAFNTPTVGQLPETVAWLDQRHAESGAPKLDLNKPEDRTVLAKMMAAEAIAAIRAAGNAVEWYDETVAKTLRTMAVKYPELNTDPDARNAFLMAMAISSQTMNVEDNLTFASAQYEEFRRNNRFPERGSGKSAPAMAGNFKLANRLLEVMGPEMTRRFLQTSVTKRELESIGFKIGGESMDEKMLGSAVFGPKIGFGFYSNLAGNFEPVTMDMWFMRTIGRLTGSLPAFDEELFPKQVAKLRAALKERGPASSGIYASQFDKELVDAARRDDDGAIALARKVYSLHNRQFIKEREKFDSGARQKTALVSAATAILKSADKPRDAPSSGGERQRLRDVVRQMVNLVTEQTGKRHPPAALQALIWYPEQELYKKLGVRLRVTSQDYAGAAQSLLTKEGFSEQRINSAAESGSGPARPVAGKSVGRSAAKAGAGRGPAGPLEGTERDAFLGERAARIQERKAAGEVTPKFSRQRQTDTPEFKRWFGDSVLTNPDGSPQVLYHGTADDVTRFDLAHPNRKDTGWLGEGVYLTDEDFIAEEYAYGKRRTGNAAPNVMPLYARLENPYTATAEDKARVRRQGKAGSIAFTADLKRQGYDGVILDLDGAREIVVFNTAAVKSAVGNNGEFSRETSDITKSAQRQTDTPEFKRWFGDSKVVDADGKPLVMYHASHRSFDTFARSFRGALFVTPDSEFANDYIADRENDSDEDNTNVMPLYVKAENPFDYDNPQHVEKVIDYLRKTNLFRGVQPGWFEGGRWDAIEDRNVQKAIKALGFDSFYVSENDVKNLGVYEPTQLKSATGNNGNFDAANPDITKSARRQVDTPKFKRWSRDLPIIEAEYADSYDGGPAVFQAYHGTTHDDITEFKNVGNKEGALGAGPYMSTSVDDVNENYAGVGPDLTNRIGREEDSVRDGFSDDPWFATQVLDDYFASEGLDQQVTDENFDELKDEYGDAAISHAATARLKGKSDGLVMPVYVRMEKPFNMATNPTQFDLTYPVDENGEPNYESEPEGSAIDLINAINEVAGWYDADASGLTDWIYENASDGVSAREVFDRANKELADNLFEDSNGDPISTGQFVQDVAREMGFDGLVQDADLYFGTQRRGLGGIRAGAMKGVQPGTLHLMPFDGAQVKSAIGNNGEFGENRDITQSKQRTDTPAFKAWFGDSVVTDEAGQPLVLYTGTSKDKDFEKFNVPKNGAWFTTSPEDASMYAKENDSRDLKYQDGRYVEVNTASRVMPVYVRIEKPATLSAADSEAMRMATNYKKVQGQIFDRLRAQGHDGVDLGGGVWVVIGSPNQIKSSIGNSGEFSTTKDKITASKQRQVDTPAFKRWFGDSQVVDADNTPKVMYHGTANDFRIFSDALIFVSPDPEFAANVGVSRSEWMEYERDETAAGASVMPVYVRAENPFDYENAEHVQALFAAGQRAGIDWLTTDAIEGGSFEVLEEPETLEIIQSLGHDAFYVNEGYGSPTKNLGLFSKNQIKSAIGNNGNFDGTNPDIAQSKQRIVGDSKRKYTPEQLAMFQNTGRTVTTPTLKERIAELRQDLGKKLAQGIVDQFRPISDLSKKAYALARLSKGASGAFEAMLHHGKLSLKDGVYDADQSGGFIERVGVPLHGELEDFLWWVAANRADRLSKEDRERLFTADDIKAGKSLDNGTVEFDYTLQHDTASKKAGTVTRDRTLIYRDALKSFDEFNKNAMDMAEQSGLIDAESRPLWEHEFYVPFYRVSEEDGSFAGGKIKSGLVRQEAFKRLKGGTDKLNGDLLANTLMNWGHLIDASAKNRAAKETLEAAVRLGGAVEADEATINAMAKSAGLKNQRTWFMDQGKKRFFVIEDPMLVTALTSLDYAGMRGPLWDALSAPKHWLTVGVTASPAFKIRNLVRDSMQAVATAPLSYNIGKNLAEGIKASDRSSQTYVSALASGGLIRFGTMLEGDTSKRTRQLIKMGVKDSTILDSESKVQAMYDKYLEPAVMAYNELGNRGEEINRASLFKQLQDQGMDQATAALMARDLMDFSMQGSWTSVRALTQVVPFMNARLQGLYKLGRAANEDPKRFAVVLGAVALASVALMLAYQDDDDWKKREDWDRNGFWWFKIGGVAFRIPKPFEIGSIATLAERGLEYFINPEMTGKRLYQNVKSLVLDSLSMNPVPQLAKPLIDLYSNKDSFTGRPIETMGMERLKSQYRYTKDTSMVARGLSTATGGAFSPVQYDHMIRGYFSWLGSFVVGAADMIVRPLTDEPTRPTADYWKFATQGIVQEVNSGSSRYVSQMYDQAKELEQAMGTYRMLQKTGRTQEAREFFQANKADIMKYGQVEKIKSAETRYNEMIRMIERSNLDPDVKKERIEKVRIQKDKIARLVAPGYRREAAAQ